MPNAPSLPVTVTNRLPLEIIETIIDACANNVQSLRSISLACRSCIYRARYHMFRTIRASLKGTDVSNSRESQSAILQSFVKVLHSNPSLGGFVRELRIYGYSDGQTLRGSLLLSLLWRLPCLRELSLHRVVISMTDVLDATTRLTTFPGPIEELYVLSLDGCFARSADDLLAVVALCHSIRSLVVLRPRVLPDMLSPSNATQHTNTSLTSRMSVQSLTYSVLGVPRPTLSTHFLAGLQHVVNIPSLRSLIIVVHVSEVTVVCDIVTPLLIGIVAEHLDNLTVKASAYTFFGTPSLLFTKVGAHALAFIGWTQPMISASEVDLSACKNLKTVRFDVSLYFQGEDVVWPHAFEILSPLMRFKSLTRIRAHFSASGNDISEDHIVQLFSSPSWEVLARFANVIPGRKVVISFDKPHSGWTLTEAMMGRIRQSLRRISLDCYEILQSA